jgi:hypothetical protein
MWGSERPFRGAGFDQMLTLADSGALIRYHPNGGSGERGKRRPSMLIAKFRPCMLAGERAATWPTATGTFRAHMEVALVNDGPVTLLLDSRKAF